MIRTDPDDLGPALDMETLEWGGGQETRKIDSGGPPPSAAATLGRPLGWWGPDRPGGKDADGWLIVRFAVSYRADQGCEIEWSRLTVELPEDTGGELIATDLFPAEEVDTERHDIHLSLSPKLQLMQVSASVGEVSGTIQVVKVLPVISSWGGQEASFGWDVSATDNYPIRGVRHFYAVIPSPGPDLAVSLGVDADARLPGGFLAHGQRSKVSQQRQVDVLRTPWD